MKFSRRISGRGSDERGFTLPEVLIVIAILGILIAIAVPVWWNVVEGRRVDSATNQLASDLRLAHSKATNRLDDWQVVLTSGSSTYQIGPEGGSLEPRSLCGDGGCGSNDPKVSFTGGGTVTITFSSDGSASVASAGAPTTFKVSVDGNPDHDIRLTTATSEVAIDP